MHEFGHGSSDPFHWSFWIAPHRDGVAGGYGVPFEDAELVLIKHFYHKGGEKFGDLRHSLPGRQAIGVGMIGFGTAMLVPGPFDLAAYAIGVAAFKHPAGGVVGVAVYNLLGLAVVGTGAIVSFG